MPLSSRDAKAIGCSIAVIVAVLCGQFFFDVNDGYYRNDNLLTTHRSIDEYLDEFLQTTVRNESLALCGQVRFFKDYGLILTAQLNETHIFIQNATNQGLDGCDAPSISIYVDVSGDEPMPSLPLQPLRIHSFQCSPFQ